MNLRNSIATFVVASACVVALPAIAHPIDYEPPTAAPEAKMPTTCAELEARTPRPEDANNPELKDLKAKCDAEKAAKNAGKPAPKPPKKD